MKPDPSLEPLDDVPDSVTDIMTDSGHAREPVLHLENVTHRYAMGLRSPEVVALSNIEFKLFSGDRVGIVGESGSGKSTLIRLLLALEHPSEGTLHFQGKQISRKAKADIDSLRRSVQIIFQDPVGSLDPRMRIGNTIAEPLRALKIPGDHDQRVAELLSLVELPKSAAGLYPHQFSGGQRQRIAIARALAPAPKILVADEAVSALDVSVRSQILNVLSEIIERLDLTLVFVSHDMGVVRHLCDFVVVLYRGNLVESGTRDAIFSSPQHPYTRALLDAVPRLGGSLTSHEILGSEAMDLHGGGCPYAFRCPRVQRVCHFENPVLSPDSSTSLHQTEQRVACHFPLPPR